MKRSEAKQARKLAEATRFARAVMVASSLTDEGRVTAETLALAAKLVREEVDA